jgi:hypothetical protein
MSRRALPVSVLLLLGPLALAAPAGAAEDYVAGSPGVVCETPQRVAEFLGYMAENNKKALSRLPGCRTVEPGAPVRIVSRERFVAKVTVGAGSNPVSGYMPTQSITNARGDPID